MKKIPGIVFAIIAFLAVAAYAGLLQERQAAVVKARSSGSATPTPAPNGDVFTDSFEGVGSGGYELDVCGSTPCWAETNDPDQAYSLPGTPPDDAGSYGLRANVAGGTSYTSYSLSSARSYIYGKMPLYIASEGLAQTNSVYVFAAADTAPNVGTLGQIQITEFSSTGTPDLRIRARGGANDSAQISISLTTWYEVEFCFPRSTDDADVCGEGNAVGWISVNGGARQTFAGGGYNDADNFTWGALIGTPTIDLIFGYFAVDDDGTY